MHRMLQSFFVVYFINVQTENFLKELYARACRLNIYHVALIKNTLGKSTITKICRCASYSNYKFRTKYKPCNLVPGLKMLM